MSMIPFGTRSSPCSVGLCMYHTVPRTRTYFFHQAIHARTESLYGVPLVLDPLCTEHTQTENESRTLVYIILARRKL